MKRWLILLILPLLSTAQSVLDTIADTEASLRALRSFHAEFEQNFYSSTVSVPLKEIGEIWFEKPDTMKWEYKNPEKKVFLSKEGTFQYYLPEDNQLIRGQIPREGHEGEVLHILSGTKRIRDSYQVEFSPFPTTQTDALQLKLTPIGEEEELYYSHILLELDEELGMITRIILHDWAGNRTEVLFQKIRKNRKFKSNTFELKIPPGVEIIEY